MSENGVPQNGGSLPRENYDFQGTIRTNAQFSTPDWPELVEAPSNAPNVVLIMTDDVGFGSSQTFGGPIRTSAFQRIADEGIKYNRFHTTALCSPTRASLLTGRLPHNVANGSITEWAGGYPGYTTLIPKSSATIARILQCNGYSTSWFGKNHNVPIWETSSVGPFDHWPNGLGFDKFYGFVGADSDQYHPVVYQDTVPCDPDTDNPDYHFDTDIADHAIQYIKNHHALTPKKPFFCYYVPGATHAPHHAPPEWIEMYEGQFNDGWTKMRQNTLDQMKSLGIVPSNTVDTMRPPGLQKWDSSDPGPESDGVVPAEEKPYYSRMAEVYAAYLSFTDHNIGRVIDAVKDLGDDVYDNTLFIYIMGDNGGSAEGTIQGTTNEIASVGNYLPEPFSHIKKAIDNNELGSDLHYNHMPAAWAWGFNAPMQWAKRYASHFGGTRNAMAMSWKNGIPSTSVGEIRDQFHHVMDIGPTILEACNLSPYYDSVDGFEQKPFDGKSMTYTWKEDAGKAKGAHKEIVFEMFGNRGLYSHERMWCTTPLMLTWELTGEQPKLTDKSFSTELYDLKGDFSQGNDLLADPTDPNYSKHKTMAGIMESRWNYLASINNIFPLSFTDEERVKANSDMPVITKDYTTFKYPSGICHVPELCAPNICNKDSKITVKFNANNLDSSAVEGTIVKLGGRFGGWGILVQAGIPYWVYKTSQWPMDTVTDVCGSKIGSGGHIIEIDCKYMGPVTTGDTLHYTQLGNAMKFSYKHTVVELSATEAYTGSGHILRSCPARFGVTETFDVGMNSGSPLIDDIAEKLPFKFNGTIEYVQVDLQSLDPEMAKLQHAASKKFNINVD